MKRILTSILLISAILPVHSQLLVRNNGNIRIGSETGAPLGAPEKSPSNITGVSVAQSDSLASLAILGSGTKASGGYISFGQRKDVTIGESTYSSLIPALTVGKLLLTGNGGFSFTCGGKTVINYNPFVTNSTVNAAVVDFSIPVTSTRFLTTSDSRYKKNILSIEDKGRLLDEVTPVSYVLDYDRIASAKGCGNDAETLETTLGRNSAAGVGTGVQFGFLAQEIREVFPELVNEDSDGMLSIDYNGFIPLLVDAVKNLNARVEEQQALIDRLSAPSFGTRSAAGVGDPESENSIVLSQNRPNPFRDRTEIRCRLPESVGSAFLCVYDLNGRQQLREDIEGRGEVTVTIEGNRLTPGIYIYSLIADGTEADTRRMILTD